MLEPFIDEARRRGASDLHLEPGLPPTLRVRGRLVTVGEPVGRAALEELVRALVGADWDAYLARRSWDLARTVRGVRCRINVLTSLRGAGLAVRLLPSTRATLDSLNLHPELRRLVEARHGLVVVSGPTGCGKSSTLAALVEELNGQEARHIITLEAPVEYLYRPRRALIRQREVGRDTPSFEQGLMDALREDPDVIVVGELREPQTMRLALGAAETGHLVLTTLHSSSTAEALQRLVMAFPPEAQASVSAQLGDCLVGAVCQRLRYRADLDLRVPECEVLWATSGVRGLVRQAGFSRLPSAIEAGGADGMFTFERYAAWAERRRDWRRPDEMPAAPEEESDEGEFLGGREAAANRRRAPGEAVVPGPRASAAGEAARTFVSSASSGELPPIAAHVPARIPRPGGGRADGREGRRGGAPRPPVAEVPAEDGDAGRLEIAEGDQSLGDLLRELERRGGR